MLSMNNRSKYLKLIPQFLSIISTLGNLLVDSLFYLYYKSNGYHSCICIQRLQRFFLAFTFIWVALTKYKEEVNFVTININIY